MHFVVLLVLIIIINDTTCVKNCHFRTLCSFGFSSYFVFAFVAVLMILYIGDFTYESVYLRLFVIIIIAERRAQMNRSRSRTNLAFNNSPDVVREISFDDANDTPTTAAKKPQQQQQRRRRENANGSAMMAQLEAALNQQ